MLQQSRQSRQVALKRRPTAVRVIVEESRQADESLPQTGPTERTPLIKAGVIPDLSKPVYDRVTLSDVQRAEQGLGRMIELGLPLIMCVIRTAHTHTNRAHEISRTIFRFRRMGFLETVGPAASPYGSAHQRIMDADCKKGVNAMQALVQSMMDQLGSMERV